MRIQERRTGLADLTTTLDVWDEAMEHAPLPVSCEHVIDPLATKTGSGSMLEEALETIRKDLPIHSQIIAMAALQHVTAMVWKHQTTPIE